MIIPASAFATDAERFEFAALIAKRLEAHSAAPREHERVVWRKLALDL